MHAYTESDVWGPKKHERSAMDTGQERLPYDESNTVGPWPSLHSSEGEYKGDDVDADLNMVRP